jgi:hypothetical protein
VPDVPEVRVVGAAVAAEQAAAGRGTQFGG